MKFLLPILMLPAISFALSVGEQVKCRGYLDKDGEEIHYILEGKILSEKKSDYFVYGVAPSFKRKILHRVKKGSCISLKEEFVKPKTQKVVVIQEEIVPEEPYKEYSYFASVGAETKKEEAPAELIKKEIIRKKPVKEVVATKAKKTEVKTRKKENLKEKGISSYISYLRYIKEEAFKL